MLQPYRHRQGDATGDCAGQGSGEGGSCGEETRLSCASPCYCCCCCCAARSRTCAGSFRARCSPASPDCCPSRGACGGQEREAWKAAEAEAAARCCQSCRRSRLPPFGCGRTEKAMSSRFSFRPEVLFRLSFTFCCFLPPCASGPFYRAPASHGEGAPQSPLFCAAFTPLFVSLLLLPCEGPLRGCSTPGFAILIHPPPLHPGSPSVYFHARIRTPHISVHSYAPTANAPHLHHRTYAADAMAQDGLKRKASRSRTQSPQRERGPLPDVPCEAPARKQEVTPVAEEGSSMSSLAGDWEGTVPSDEDRGAMPHRRSKSTPPSVRSPAKQQVCLRVCLFVC